MPPNLRTTQRWLVEGIIRPDAPDAAKRLRPSRTLSPEQRLEIYRELYPARLVSALKSDYPLLCEHLGGPLFTQLALLYAQARPSRSFTLNAFGEALPEFLSEIRGLKRPELVRDIAVFEQASTQCFHAAEARALDAEAIAAVPARKWPKARLLFHPAVRLLQLDYPVWRLKQGRAARKQQSPVVIFRRDQEVHSAPMTPGAFAVLKLLHDGSPLAKALTGNSGPVKKWFAEWAAAGLFTAIRL